MNPNKALVVTKQQDLNKEGYTTTEELATKAGYEYDLITSIHLPNFQDLIDALATDQYEAVFFESFNRNITREELEVVKFVAEADAHNVTIHCTTAPWLTNTTDPDLRQLIVTILSRSANIVSRMSTK